MSILRLKDLLKEKEITGKELADEVGLSVTGMSNIVKGKSLPRQDILLKIATKLDVDIKDLFHSTKDNDLETLYIKEGEKFIPIGEVKQRSFR